MNRILAALLLLMVAGAGGAAVVGKDVDYTLDGTTFKGFIAYDDSAKGRRPAVLVVHEWWGANDYARERARKLAALGYVAMALDMYGEGRQASHPDEAGKFAGEVASNLPLARARFTAALTVLKQDPHSDATQIAAIGYCFGGGIVLQMAREGLELKGVASFHGSLATSHPAAAGAIKASILVAHGGADPFVSSDQVTAFLKEMNDAQADYRFIVYSGAVHGFTNPDADSYGNRFKLPLHYNRQADTESWQALQQFLARVFAR